MRLTSDAEASGSRAISKRSLRQPIRMQAGSEDYVYDDKNTAAAEGGTLRRKEIEDMTVNGKTLAGAGFAAAAAIGLALGTATTAGAAPVGPGCAAYVAQVPDGPGSVQGMAQSPLTVAASNNPLLTTLTKAVSGQLNPEVNLVETLDGAEFTVFAPTDDAFAKLDPATIEALKTDAPLLTNILTYHVVPGQADPSAVVGTHTTVQGADVTVTGHGDQLRVNDASVVCGGVQTANATVYLIDSVLLPPA